MTSKPPPFPKDKQLDKDVSLSGTTWSSGNAASVPNLPGQPALRLTNPLMLEFLKQDLLTPSLDQIASRLWLVATPSHSHISPLHHHIVRGRDIIVAEDPQMHLLWINSRVFIKPLPLYLLSHAIWAGCLSDGAASGIPRKDSQCLESAALGYLRTWHYLIRHESDFRIAQEHHLIHKSVSWPDFHAFIDHFAHISNLEVNHRYRYGSLRLSRLNIWAPVFLGQWNFRRVHGQYAEYFAQFYGPVLFAFAVFSTSLSAMQVVLASGVVWDAFVRTSKWFSVVTLLVVIAVCSYLLAMWSFMVLRETVFAVRHLSKRKHTV